MLTCHFIASPKVAGDKSFELADVRLDALRLIGVDRQSKLFADKRIARSMGADCPREDALSGERIGRRLAGHPGRSDQCGASCEKAGTPLGGNRP